MTVVIVAFFPTIESLEDEGFRSNEFISLDGMVDILNQYIAAAAARSGAEDEGPQPMLAKAWRYLDKLPIRKPDEQRMSKKSREGLLRHVLKFYELHDFVATRNEEEQLRITAKKRMRIQARELIGNELFIYLTELGGKTPETSADIPQRNGGADDA
jgi:hypothetical protein